MYYAIIAACFVVLPIASILIEWIVRRKDPASRDLVVMIAKWFTFWIVGVRLFVAGVTQALVPEYTAQTIFGTEDPQVLPFISELGYANIAIGTVGLVSLFKRTWTAPAALLGAVFLGLDGVRHVIEGGDFTPERTVAMVSDLLAVVVLGGSLIALAIRRTRRRSPV
jgi:hypothetical protein